MQASEAATIASPTQGSCMTPLTKDIVIIGRMSERKHPTLLFMPDDYSNNSIAPRSEEGDRNISLGLQLRL